MPASVPYKARAAKSSKDANNPPAQGTTTQAIIILLIVLAVFGGMIALMVIGGKQKVQRDMAFARKHPNLAAAGGLLGLARDVASI